MTFNIARQPFVPAFLTLAALAAAFAWRVDLHAGAHVVSAIEKPALLPGELLSLLQATCPMLSRILVGVMILWSGLCVGRISTRYGLYAVNSCLAIPLYGIIACTIIPEEHYLATFAASMILAIAMQHFCRTCRNGYSFDAIFVASFYLGAVPLIYIPALPLLLLLPLAILFFRRTFRELTVALIGLLLPALTVCYVAWGCGYNFIEPLLRIKDSLTAEVPFLQFFSAVDLPGLILLGTVVALGLTAIFLFLAHAYTAGSKPRYILSYNIGVFALTLALVFMPAAKMDIITFIAIPTALFLPVLFVRIHHTLATPLYLILLAAAFAGIFLL